MVTGTCHNMSSNPAREEEEEDRKCVIKISKDSVNFADIKYVYIYIYI